MSTLEQKLLTIEVARFLKVEVKYCNKDVRVYQMLMHGKKI
ncbi:MULTISPECIES: hypothetical protein [Nostocales]|uniref:Transposase n=2 Tax=Nostocales TaxID=1161 RepID=A0ABW8WGN6_9CYAN|nr:hypothetical protein [Tolypothrix bouteillei]